ncbi:MULTISPECIES: 5-formyltetrahydrofolate cyclo-ligase [Salinibaculum]|uniref:5-formyltetrahydrofolate cyclo-ligase n=1 Tax=Salinibaculum TaxID=2732368 RepID=UPI0030CB7596
MDKQALRERVWDDLEASGEARFPFPPHGRIPNFAGADAAAQRLADEPEFRAADAIKINPDSPQRPVRRLALEAGKTLYMAVPRLAEEECFVELDPDRIDDIDNATTIGGADEEGVQVPPDDVAPIDLVVSGSVAVTEDGDRIGKGEGYSDLEYALLLELGLVDGETPVATTVHERQVVEGPVETAAHDVGMDLVVTPERVVRPGEVYKPAGIDWALLSEERIAEIPVLERFRL